MTINKKYAAAAIAAMIATAGGLSVALAKEKQPDIQSDTSGLPAELSTSIARTALAMGVKEPLSISKHADSAQISGSNQAVCTVKLSNGAEPKMLGISCK